MAVPPSHPIGGAFGHKFPLMDISEYAMLPGTELPAIFDNFQIPTVCCVNVLTERLNVRNIQIWSGFQAFL